MPFFVSVGALLILPGVVAIYLVKKVIQIRRNRQMNKIFERYKNEA